MWVFFFFLVAWSMIVPFQPAWSSYTGYWIICDWSWRKNQLNCCTPFHALAAQVVLVKLGYILFCVCQLEASHKIAFTDPTGAFLISHWSTGFHNSFITLSSAAFCHPLSHRLYLKLTLWLTRLMRSLFSPLRGHATCRLLPQPFQLLWLLNLGTPGPPVHCYLDPVEELFKTIPLIITIITIPPPFFKWKIYKSNHWTVCLYNRSRIDMTVHNNSYVISRPFP